MSPVYPYNIFILHDFVICIQVYVLENSLPIVGQNLHRNIQHNADIMSCKVTQVRSGNCIWILKRKTACESNASLSTNDELQKIAPKHMLQLFPPFPLHWLLPSHPLHIPYPTLPYSTLPYPLMIINYPYSFSFLSCSVYTCYYESTTLSWWW